MTSEYIDTTLHHASRREQRKVCLRFYGRLLWSHEISVLFFTNHDTLIVADACLSDFQHSRCWLCIDAPDYEAYLRLLLCASDEKNYNEHHWGPRPPVGLTAGSESRDRKGFRLDEIVLVDDKIQGYRSTLVYQEYNRSNCAGCRSDNGTKKLPLRYTKIHSQRIRRGLSTVYSSTCFSSLAGQQRWMSHDVVKFGFRGGCYLQIGASHLPKHVPSRCARAARGRQPYLIRQWRVSLESEWGSNQRLETFGRLQLLSIVTRTFPTVEPLFCCIFYLLAPFPLSRSVFTPLAVSCVPLVILLSSHFPARLVLHNRVEISQIRLQRHRVSISRQR